MGCVFCERIQNGEYEQTATDGVVMFEPLNPVVEGHMLFVPERHVQHAAFGPQQAAAAIYAAATYGAGKGDFNIITSAGRAATQTIDHLHIHFVPRVADDKLRLPWTGQKK